MWSLPPHFICAEAHTTSQSSSTWLDKSSNCPLTHTHEFTDAHDWLLSNDLIDRERACIVMLSWTPGHIIKIWTRGLLMIKGKFSVLSTLLGFMVLITSLELELFAWFYDFIQQQSRRAFLADESRWCALIVRKLLACYVGSQSQHPSNAIQQQGNGFDL